MINCDKCKMEAGGLGFPAIPVLEREGVKLEVSLMADDGDCSSADDCDEFREEFAGDWCESCARKKITQLMAAFSPM